MASNTSGKEGGCRGLPNSVISAPALKPRPEPISTMARAPAFFAACNPSKRPARTSVRSVLTGGVGDAEDVDVAVGAVFDEARRLIGHGDILRVFLGGLGCCAASSVRAARPVNRWRRRNPDMREGRCEHHQ